MELQAKPAASPCTPAGPMLLNCSCSVCSCLLRASKPPMAPAPTAPTELKARFRLVSVVLCAKAADRAAVPSNPMEFCIQVCLLALHHMLMQHIIE